jgi:hypothetical protein
MDHRNQLRSMTGGVVPPIGSSMTVVSLSSDSRSAQDFGDSSVNTTTTRRWPSLVPTLRVGMPGATLRVATFGAARGGDAERPGRHSHAPRGNEEPAGGGVERGLSDYAS